MKVYNGKGNSDMSRMDMVYTWIIFSLHLHDNLDARKIHYCGPVRHIIEKKSSVWKLSHVQKYIVLQPFVIRYEPPEWDCFFLNKSINNL